VIGGVVVGSVDGVAVGLSDGCSVGKNVGKGVMGAGSTAGKFIFERMASSFASMFFCVAIENVTR
jgi:hypothetical protein